MNKRKLAKITGWSLILMALISGFSLGYAYPEVYNSESINSSKNLLVDNLELYKSMLLGIAVILILDFIVSYTLYNFFKKDNRKVSLLSGVLRAVYTLLFGIAAVYLVNNINVVELSNDSINNNFHQYQSIWSVGLILFGFHLVLVGLLMKIHKRIPKILWYITLIAGFSYIIVHLLKLISIHSNIVGDLEMILALPMALGELGLALWLIIKGGKESQ